MAITIFDEVKFASVKVAVYILLREFVTFLGFLINIEIWKMVGERLGESLGEWKGRLKGKIS